MGVVTEFDDRDQHLLAETEAYHPYEYQEEGNGSWAGALPVKQQVPLTSRGDKRLLIGVMQGTLRP